MVQGHGMPCADFLQPRLRIAMRFGFGANEISAEAHPIPWFRRRKAFHSVRSSDEDSNRQNASTFFMAGSAAKVLQDSPHGHPPVTQKFWAGAGCFLPRAAIGRPPSMGRRRSRIPARGAAADCLWEGGVWRHMFCICSANGTATVFDALRTAENRANCKRRVHVRGNATASVERQRQWAQCQARDGPGICAQIKTDAGKASAATRANRATGNKQWGRCATVWTMSRVQPPQAWAPHSGEWAFRQGASVGGPVLGLLRSRLGDECAHLLRP